MDTFSFIKKSKEKYGERFDYSKVIYINTKTKITLICPEHGEFSVTPNNHLSHACGCPGCRYSWIREKRRSENLIAKNSFLKKVREKFPGYDFSKSAYTTSKEDVIVICPEHGEFSIRAENLLSSRSKYPCKKCSARRSSFNQAEKTRGEERLLEMIKKFGVTIGKHFEYKNNRTPVTLVCKKHGEFKIIPSVFYRSKFGCPLCGNEIRKSRTEIELERAMECISEYKIDCPNLYNKPFDFFIPRLKLLLEVQGKQHFSCSWSMTGGDLKKRKELDNLKKQTALNLGYNYLEFKAEHYRKKITEKLIDIINSSTTIEIFEERIKDLESDKVEYTQASGSEEYRD